MRVAVLAAIVTVAAIPGAAEAHVAYSPAQVTLTVDDSCKIETPHPVRLSTIAKSGASALLPNCRTGVTPLITFANDSAKGAYLATIDF